jgi:5-methyltetrahydropteroyltriglutamate--homocysteine methyltransferase
MKRSTDRLITTHPGRLPNPSVGDETIAARNSGDRARFDALVKQGALEMFAKQRSVGVDVMSDGEFWKARDARYYDERVTGITSRPLREGETVSTVQQQRERQSAEFGTMWRIWEQVGNAPLPGVVNSRGDVRYVMSGEVKAKEPVEFKKDIEVIKGALAEGGYVPDDYYFPVLGPGWLDHFVWNEFYKTEEEYCYALATVVKNDFKAVIDAGFDLQIDDPGLNDRYGMIDPEPSIEEYRRQEQIRIEATNWALEGIPEERVRYHTCWGSWHTPHTTDIPFEHTVDLMLQIKAIAYSIEAADIRHEWDYQVFEDGRARLPDGKIYIPGVVAHKTTTVETPEIVARRLIQYAKLFGKENIIAGVDCGIGGRAYPDIGWAKLKVLSEGAALASKTLWAK